MTDDPLAPGIKEPRDVASGWQVTVVHDDGTATKVWGPTKEAARRNAQNVLRRDGV